MSRRLFGYPLLRHKFERPWRCPAVAPRSGRRCVDPLDPKRHGADHAAIAQVVGGEIVWERWPYNHRKGAA